MKKRLSFSAIMMLVAAIVLTSCGKQQDKTDTDVPLKVTYIIDCSTDLLDLCDLVVTYKGDDGVNVIDTISAAPADSTSTQTWTKTIGTHEIPVKIGFDYTFVQKTDTLLSKDEWVSLIAKCTIVAEKIGTRTGIAYLSENTINSKKNFYRDFFLMDEDVINTRRNLATIIDIYNDRQAYKRGTTDNNTCFIINPHPYGKGLIVERAPWND